MFVVFLRYLSVFVRKIFSDSSMKKEQLNSVMLHGKSRGDNIFQSFCPSLLKINVPVHISLCQSLQMALGTRLMKRLAYCALLEISHFPSLLFHNCVIHRQSLHLDTRVETLIVATIYLQLIQNRYMFRSFTVLHCSHQHCLEPVASDVEVVGYL